MPYCLPTHLIGDFLQAVKDGKIDPVKMMDMASEQRSELLAKFVGEDNASKVNALYESKLLLKDQQKGMITWIKNVGGITPKRRSDLISRVNKLEEALNPETEDAFLNDLVAQKLGVTVTMEEASNISELARIATEKKVTMEASDNRREIGRLQGPTSIENAYGAAGVAFRNYINDLKLAEGVTKDKFFADPVGTTQRLLFEAANNPTNSFMVAAGISKTLKTVFDNSVILRQGLKTFFARNNIWRKNAKQTFTDMYRTVGGEAVMDDIDAAIISHPLYDNMIRDRLAIAVIEDEIPQAKLLEGIPGIGKIIEAGENAFSGFAYRTRVDLYEAYSVAASKQGITDTKDLGLGILANSMTGRGSLGRAEGIADVLNVAFFSLRNAKSNFDTLTAHMLNRKVSRFAKKEAVKELLKIGMGIYATLAIASAMGGDVEWDRTSSDFGTVKLGNTRYDFTGGMKSLVVLFQRLWSGQTKSATTGKVSEIRGKDLFTRDGLDLLIDYFQNKLAPLPSVIANVLLQGHTFNEDEATSIATTARDLTVPISLESAREIWQDPESGPLLLSIVAEFMGIGTNTFGSGKKSTTALE